MWTARTTWSPALSTACCFVLIVLAPLHPPALQRQPPLGVSMASVVYLLAKQSVEMGAFKLARFAYNKLQTLVLPPAWQEEVDLQSVLIRSKPISDKEELLPVCYRCSTTNPLLNPQVRHLLHHEQPRVVPCPGQTCTLQDCLSV
jgi:intraflagellar transport protein 122